MIECRACEVLQTVDHHEDVSPDYVHLKKENIDGDRLWCQGDHKRQAFKRWATQVEFLKNHSVERLRLLDIGCGTGGFLKYAQGLGMETFGFDASRAQVEYAKKEFPNVRCAYIPSEYIRVLGMTGLRFDVVTMWDVLEHVRNPLEFLRDVHDILRPGGLFFASIPNGKAMLWKRRIQSLLGVCRDPDWAPWEHVFYYTMKSLNDYVRMAGFQVLKSGAVACYPRPLSIFEVVRRFAFLCLRTVPSHAPQIYMWAQAPVPIAKKGDIPLFLTG